MGKKFLNLGTGTLVSTIAIGSIPNISGTPAEANIKANTMTGLSNIGKTLPTHGKLIGAGMVLKQVKKLNKKTKSF